jgi:hypothetical protein
MLSRTARHTRQTMIRTTPLHLPRLASENYTTHHLNTSQRSEPLCLGLRAQVTGNGRGQNKEGNRCTSSPWLKHTHGDDGSLELANMRGDPCRLQMMQHHSVPKENVSTMPLITHTHHTPHTTHHATTQHTPDIAHRTPHHITPHNTTYIAV